MRLLYQLIYAHNVIITRFCFITSPVLKELVLPFTVPPEPMQPSLSTKFQKLTWTPGGFALRRAARDSV